MRRRASVVVLVGLGLLAGGLVAAPPATAAAADEVVYVAAGAGGSVLRVRDLATGADSALTGSTVNADPANVDVRASRDGRRIALVTYDAAFNGDSLAVYDRDTGRMTALGSVGPDAVYTGVAWLPDGEHLLVGPMTPEGRTPLDLLVVGVDGSSRALVGTKGIGDFDLSPSGRQVVYTVLMPDLVPHVWMANVDGTSRVDLKVVGRAPRWSHGGTRILATLDVEGPDGVHTGGLMESFTLQGTRRALVDASYLPGYPSYEWSSDDSAVLASTGAVVRQLDLGTGAWTDVVSTTGGAAYAGPWTPPDTTPPVLAFPPHVALEDTSVLFGWGSLTAPGTDVVGMRIALAPGMTPPATYTAGTRRLTVLGRQYLGRVTGLVPGTTYSYSFWALDASGNVSTPATGHLRMIASTAAVATAPLASTTSTGGWIRLTYATTAVGAAGVVLQDRALSATGGGGSFTAFYPGIQLGRSGTYYFGRGGYPETLVGGTTYTFCVGTRDAWGNPHWSSTCASSVFPLDDRDRTLSYAGAWSRVTATGAWQGTTSMTSTGGAAAYRLVYRGGQSAKRFTVLATTSAAGGRFKVYVDGRYVTTVSTRTSTTMLRRAVWTSAALSRSTHTVRIVQVAGSGWVRFDGLAVVLQ
jgi:hypothetical protein